MSPIVANLFMEWFEVHAINSFAYEITIWRRYDTIVAICDSLVDDFTSLMNSIHPAIQFSREEEVDRSIAMLDSKIPRNTTGKLSSQCTENPPTLTNTCNSIAISPSNTNEV